MLACFSLLSPSYSAQPQEVQSIQVSEEVWCVSQLKVDLIPPSPRRPDIFRLVRKVGVFLTSRSTLFRKALGGQVYSDY